MSELQFLHPAQSGSGVLGICEGTNLLGVNCLLKAATHRCRRGECHCFLMACGIDENVSASFQTKVVDFRDFKVV